MSGSIELASSALVRCTSRRRLKPGRQEQASEDLARTKGASSTTIWRAALQAIADGRNEQLTCEASSSVLIRTERARKLSGQITSQQCSICKTSALASSAVHQQEALSSAHAFAASASDALASHSKNCRLGASSASSVQLDRCTAQLPRQSLACNGVLLAVRQARVQARSKV